jgi:hypothetical protein
MAHQRLEDMARAGAIRRLLCEDDWAQLRQNVLDLPFSSGKHSVEQERRMKSALKFEQAVLRIERMLHEVKLIEIDAHDIIEDAEGLHRRNFAEFDILNDDVRLAERSASDQVSHAKTLRSATRSIGQSIEVEIRRLRDNNPFV